MSKKELYREIIKRYVESYNRLDVDGMLLNADPEITFVNISNGEVDLRTNGIEELRNQAEKAKQYFAHWEQVITGMRFGDQEVEINVDFRGD